MKKVWKKCFGLEMNVGFSVERSDYERVPIEHAVVRNFCDKTVVNVKTYFLKLKLAVDVVDMVVVEVVDMKWKNTAHDYVTMTTMTTKTALRMMSTMMTMTKMDVNQFCIWI